MPTPAVYLREPSNASGRDGNAGLRQPLPGSPKVAEIFDQGAAARFGLVQGEVVVTIHSGSRGLGDQIGTDFLREMALAAPGLGIRLPDWKLACAPIRSDVEHRYLGAMCAAINCAREPPDHHLGACRRPKRGVALLLLRMPGAGRAMSRHQALKHWTGHIVVEDLAARGINSLPVDAGVGGGAPGAYKDVAAVIDATERAGLARKVARLVPKIVVKGLKTL